MGSDTDKVLSKCPNPHADFTYSPSTPEVEELVEFDASPSSGGGKRIISYYWDFGDTNTSYIKKPVHRYSKPGTYTVKLIIENQCGSKSVRTKKLTVVKKGAGKTPTPTPRPTRTPTPTPRPTKTPRPTRTPTPTPTPRPVTLKCLKEGYSCESTGADYPPYTRCEYNVKLKLPRTLHTDIVEFDAKIHCFYERSTGGGEKEKVLHITEALVNYSDTLTLYESDREFYPDYDFARATRAYMEWGAQTITDGEVTLTIEAGSTPGVTKETSTPTPRPTRTPTPTPRPTETPTPVPSTGAKTRLVVDSIPSGAEIYIDGKRTGKKTPAVVEID